MTPRLHEFSALGPGGFSRIGYVEWGPEDAQRTVVCLHGLTRNSRDFDFLAQRLVAMGMRVVAPDLPGRGRSEWIPRPEEYGTPLYVATMAAVIARLGVTELDWVGTSLGGHIGMELAALPGTPIRRLVLNDFGARVQALSLQRIRSYVGAAPQFDSIDEAEAYVRRTHAPYGALTDEQWHHLTEHYFVRTADGRLRVHYDPNIGKQFSLPLLMDIVLWRVWEKVSCPVLILRGAESDLLLAATIAEMKRRGTAAARGLVQSVEFSGCGHVPILMTETQTRPIEDFLTGEHAMGSVAAPKMQGRVA